MRLTRSPEADNKDSWTAPSRQLNGTEWSKSFKLLDSSWQVKRERKRGDRKTGRRGVGEGVVEWGGNRRGLLTEREGVGGVLVG
jgi:hypothetical protein